MNIESKVAALALALTICAPALNAQITSIPYADGSDGALNVTVSTNIDLSKAASGNWTNTSASPGLGTYDTNQWAVVFKYTSVNIAAGATVTFSNHITHAPVVWLVGSAGTFGNVTINGNLSLDGQPGTTVTSSMAEPGPGGFRGGSAPLPPQYGAGPGFGPGSGANQNGNYFGVYGNQQLVPLIGGSGGSGSSGTSFGGSGGGGALLIATGGTITNNGPIHADGNYVSGHSPSGSGGAIRLVANQIVVNGTIEALSLGQSANGIIRLEATNITGTAVASINPTPQSAVPSNTPTIFAPAATAYVTVTSISNQTANLPAPADPKAIMSASPGADDFAMVTTNPVTIWLKTLNFPTNGAVTVYVKSQYGPQTTPPAVCVSGNSNSAIWQATANLPYPAHTIIQARAAY